MAAIRIKRLLSVIASAALLLTAVFTAPLMFPLSAAFADAPDIIAWDTPLNFVNGYPGARMMLLKYEGRASFGNANPHDPYAQWRVFYNQANGRTALRNEGSGEYLGVNQHGMLQFFEDRTYSFILLPPAGAVYPGVRFRGADFEDRFLHIEGFRTNHFAEFSNAVEPNWGTPHWEPQDPADAADIGDLGQPVAAPSGYVRLFSYYEHQTAGQFLMQNRRAMAHGNFRAADARTHWRFEAAGGGMYFLVNRLSGQLAVNLGNDIINVLDRDDAVLIGGGAGARWRVTSAGSAGVIMLGNVYADRPLHIQPFLNISAMSGLAESSLVSIRDNRAYWIFEAAPDPDDDTAPTEAVALNPFDDGGLYRASDGGGLLASTYRLQRYGNQVRLQDSVTDRFIFFDGTRFQSKVLASILDTDTLWNINYSLGVTYITMRGARVELTQIESQVIYWAEDAHRRDDRLLFTVFSERTASFAADIVAVEAGDVTIRINGLNQTGAMIPARNLNFPLNKGTNIVEVTGDTDGVRSLVFHEIMAPDFFGASLNTRTYQAEDMQTNADVVLESRLQNTVAGEMSGRTGVRIGQTHHFVRWTLSAPANALVLRASIPDNAAGTGQDHTISLYANNVRIGAVDLTSRYSWLYGSYGQYGGDGAAQQWSNNPAWGNARMFFSESRKILPQAFPAGTEFMLRKDLTDHAEFYYIDFVETQLIDGALAQPYGAACITLFGADEGANGSAAANLNALRLAMNLARTLPSRTVFIPAGTFNFPQEEHTFGNDTFARGANIILGAEFSGLTVRGAGVWHTNVTGGLTFTFEGANDVSFFDIAFVGNEIVRRNAVARATFEGTSHGFIAHNLWINRYKVGFWFDGGSNYFIAGNRVHDLFADGVNLTLGAVNSMITQNCWRYPGDDAIAQWSQGQRNYNNVVSFNTVALPWLANGIAAYGGNNLTFRRNIVRDTIYVGAAINISTNFAPSGQTSPVFLGRIEISQNLFERTGSRDAAGRSLGAVWIFVHEIAIYADEFIIRDNIIHDSTFSGISIDVSVPGAGSQVRPGSVHVTNLTVKNNVFDIQGTFALDVGATITGDMLFVDNVIREAADDINNLAGDNFTITVIENLLPVVNSPPDRVFNRGGSPSNPAAIAFVIIGPVLLLGGAVFFTVVFIKRRKGAK